MRKNIVMKITTIKNPITMSFLEFTTIVKGFKFTLKGNPVFNYQLFYRRVCPYKLIEGNTEYSKHPR